MNIHVYCIGTRTSSVVAHNVTALVNIEVIKSALNHNNKKFNKHYRLKFQG